MKNQLKILHEKLKINRIEYVIEGTEKHMNLCTQKLETTQILHISQLQTYKDIILNWKI